MPRKITKSKDTPAAQHKRFVETAKKLGADESPEAFDRAFKRVTKSATRPK
jgi:hypothetical protein